MSGPQVLPPVTAPPVLDGDKDAEVAAFLRAAQGAGLCMRGCGAS